MEILGTLGDLCGFLEPESEENYLLSQRLLTPPKLGESMFLKQNFCLLFPDQRNSK